MSGERDAIDFVCELRTGEAFTLRGRRFTLAGYYGWSHYEGRVVVPVWNASGREVFVTVRATDKVARA